MARTKQMLVYVPHDLERRCCCGARFLLDSSLTAPSTAARLRATFDTLHGGCWNLPERTNT